MCFNRKMLIGLGVVALGVLVLAPGAFGAALPVLVLLACPLSMLFMMRGMGRGSGADERRTTGRAAPGSDQAATELTDPELVRLRAEVDQLHAELADRRGSDTGPGASGRIARDLGRWAVRSPRPR